MTSLNLGCGEFPLKGFVNIDVYKTPCTDLECNIIKLPYKDNSIDEIYAGHVIEHLSMEEAKKALREWLRVLKQGSKIGIVVPDKDNAPDKYVYDKSPERKKYSNHNSYWNYEMLEEELTEAGFEDAEKMNIDTYPHLVARPHWQVGIYALKGIGKTKGKTKGKKIGKIKPSLGEIEEHKKAQDSWCKNEGKFVYNPTLKKHCPFCRRLL